MCDVANVRDRVEGASPSSNYGRLTVNDHPGMLKEAVAGASAAARRTCCIDLSGVHYIDSTRLGELIAAHVTVTRQGGRLKLVAHAAPRRRAAVIAGLGGVFERFESVDEATTSSDGSG